MPGCITVPTARPTPTASTAVSANQAKVRPPSAAIDFCPCSEAIALITAKNTSGIAIILIRVTYRSPSGPNQVSAAGPMSQPASAPRAKPASTRFQNRIRNHPWNIGPACGYGNADDNAAGARSQAAMGKSVFREPALREPMAGSLGQRGPADQG